MAGPCPASYISRTISRPFDNAQNPNLTTESRCQVKAIYQAAIGTVAVAIAIILFVGRTTTADPLLATADRDFILNAAQCGLAKVKLGELASQRGRRADIKEFGRLMVQEHTAMNVELAALAMQKGVRLPASLDAKHQALVDQLSALTGDEFDKAYLAAMLNEHQHSAQGVKAEPVATKDADIKSFADKYITAGNEDLQYITTMHKSPAA